MKKILPIILALIGTGAGVGAGIFLAPEPTPSHTETSSEATGDEGDAEHPAEAHTADDHAPDGDDHDEGATKAFIKLSNQFVIPVVEDDRIRSLVVIALSLEVPTALTEDVYAREPKLRDVFLRAMFDHANIGGFEGNFTESQRLAILRRALLESARSVMGKDVSDVLITEIARQDN